MQLKYTKNIFDSVRYEGFSGEKKFLIALIEQAISDYLEPELWQPRQNAYFDQKSARNWLFEKAKEPLRPFSFAWVCQHLTHLDNKTDVRTAILARIESYSQNEVPPQLKNLKKAA